MKSKDGTMPDIDHKNTPQPVCPHCGNMVLYAWELDFTRQQCIGGNECGRCGKKFTICQRVTVTYNTHKD